MSDLAQIVEELSRVLVRLRRHLEGPQLDDSGPRPTPTSKPIDIGNAPPIKGAALFAWSKKIDEENPGFEVNQFIYKRSKKMKLPQKWADWSRAAVVELRAAAVAHLAATASLKMGRNWSRAAEDEDRNASY